MFEAEFKSLYAGLSLRDAVLVILRTPELHTDDHGCTLGGLDMALSADYEGDVYTEVLALIASREAYVAEPISLADADSYVGLVRWTVGASTRADIEKEFGPPHGTAVSPEGRTLIYDIYVENVDDPDDYPPPPASYAVREAEDGYRPEDCNFPFTAIWPPEAIQIKFEFDRSGVLGAFDFVVGDRLT
jgi:hypothetical protein